MFLHLHLVSSSRWDWKQFFELPDVTRACRLAEKLHPVALHLGCSKKTMASARVCSAAFENLEVMLHLRIFTKTLPGMLVPPRFSIFNMQAELAPPIPSPRFAMVTSSAPTSYQIHHAKQGFIPSNEYEHGRQLVFHWFSKS